MKKTTRKIVLSGLFIALGIVLPFFTGQVPKIGNMLLPMHIPVLLSGYVLGGFYGMLIGFVTPILRSLIIGLPYMFPAAVSMAFELASYGLVTGILYKYLPKKKVNIFVSLISAMVLGRIAWAMARLYLYGVQGTPFNMKIFIEGAFLLAIPGIVIQIVLIPIIIIALEGANLIERN